MLQTRGDADRKSKRIIARGEAVGISLAGLLIGLSLVIFSLRKVRLKVELKREG